MHCGGCAAAFDLARLQLNFGVVQTTNFNGR